MVSDWTHCMRFFFVCLLLVYFLDFVIIFVLIYFCLQVVMLFRIWFLVVSSTDITWTEFVWYQSTIKVCLFFGSECCGFFFRFLQARSQGQSLTDQCGVSVSVFFLSCFVVGFRIGSRRTWSHGRSILISAEPLLHSEKLSFIFFVNLKTHVGFFFYFQAFLLCDWLIYLVSFFICFCA